MMTAWRLGTAARRLHESMNRDVTEYALHRQIDILQAEIERLERENAWLHECIRRRPGYRGGNRHER